VKKLADMEGIAALVAFLCGDLGSAISGQAIAIDCDAKIPTLPLRHSGA
jgi:enoyl-[acyl-carrier-protein] reductase (NADH)